MKFFLKTAFVKLVVKILIFVLIIPVNRPANAFVAPQLPATYAANRAIAAAITKTAISRGVASSDARIAMTMGAVSNKMTALNVVSTVGGVAIGIAGAPVWLSVAAAVGILAVGTALIVGTTKLEIDPLTSEVVVSRLPGDVTPAYSAPYRGPALTINYLGFNGLSGYFYKQAEMYRTDFCYTNQECAFLPPEPKGFRPLIRVVGFGKNLLAERGHQRFDGSFVVWFRSIEEFRAKYHLPRFHWNQMSYESDWHAIPGLEVALYPPGQSLSEIYTTFSWTTPPTIEVNEAGEARMSGWYIVQRRHLNGPPGSNFTTSPQFWSSNIYSNTDSPSNVADTFSFGAEAFPQRFNRLDDAWPHLERDLDKNLSSADVAKIVDAAWKRASEQAGYQGLPYSAPVTAADIDAGDVRITLKDMLRATKRADQALVPISMDLLGDGSSDPSVPAQPIDVNVVNVPRVRVEGEVSIVAHNPNIPLPADPDGPTMGVILSPILNLFPDFRSNLWPPLPAGQCGTETFEMLGRTFRFDSHCTVLEPHRETIRSIFTLGYSLLAAAIIMSA